MDGKAWAPASAGVSGNERLRFHLTEIRANLLQAGWVPADGPEHVYKIEQTSGNRSEKLSVSSSMAKDVILGRMLPRVKERREVL
jgi:hypothetical protein